MQFPISSKVLPLTIAGILSTGMISANTALADNAQETVSVTPGRTVNPTEVRVMSRYAAHILHYIADARSAINAKNIRAAKSDLNRAHSLIGLLRLEQPTAIVRDHISVAKQHLDYESVEEVTNDLVPIEASLSEIEAFVPVEKARKHTRFARERLKKNDKAGAKKELEAADAALIYTEVDLPIASTSRNINLAQLALDNNQLEQADDALNQAEEGVKFLSTTVVAPITQARNSLWQASKDYIDKDYTAVKEDIARAGVWLDKAAQSTDNTTRKEAGKLKRELEGIRGKIDQRGESSQSSLKNMWHRSQALAEREVEKMSAEWGKLRADSEAKVILIDAKLRIAYAESAQFTQGKSREVDNELDAASADLARAAKVSSKTLAEKIHTLSDKLAKIKRSEKDHSAEAHKRYELIKADLRQTIHDL
ncbi:MAG: hypothetical protein methR_P1241 [Methyloprofundus sp.]|nr:MAG: hypothetical protein methR_P1241 [Methyloprofundus sp.]